MIKFFNWVKNNPNRAMFLVPILLVAGISISHVVTWYDMANPISWAIYLSIAIEVAAITALVAATNKVKGGVWFMFSLVTFIQMLGNIFYCYKEIDPSGELFTSWIELTGPIWEFLGSDATDVPSMKRYLAFLEGGLLPVISLTSLHFFVKYQKEEEEGDESVVEPNEPTVPEKPVEEGKDFEKIVQDKKKKIEEDKKIFEPLLSQLYSSEKNIKWSTTDKNNKETELKSEKISAGDILPTYLEFRSQIDPKFTNDNIKMFLTLCNYLDITELSDNTRKAKVDYDTASAILSKYLTLDDEPKPTGETKITPKDWWSSSKSKK